MPERYVTLPCNLAGCATVLFLAGAIISAMLLDYLPTGSPAATATYALFGLSTFAFFFMLGVECCCHMPFGPFNDVYAEENPERIYLTLDSANV